MKPKYLWTLEREKFVKDNHKLLSGSAMAERICCDKGVMRRYMKANGYLLSKEERYALQSETRKGQTTFTREEDKFINENFLTLPIKTLAEKIGRSYTGVMGRINAMGLVLPPEIIHRNRESARIKPGNVPRNKGLKQIDFMSAEAIERTKVTRFKKGQIPASSYNEIGKITLRHDHKKRGGKPYKYICIALGKWLPLHTHLWQQSHGKLPKGHCLWFIDGDTSNCELNNLELITRAENMARNSVANLSDNSVANYLATECKKVDKELKKELLNHPELISAKRTQLLIKRKIKSYGKK
jgi:hypothetical protein